VFPCLIVLRTEHLHLEHERFNHEATAQLPLCHRHPPDEICFHGCHASRSSACNVSSCSGSSPGITTLAALNPCFKAFHFDAARPASDLGPVLRWAFSRLASACRKVVISSGLSPI